MTQRELFDLTDTVLENNENRDAIAEKFGDIVADHAVQIATDCGPGAIEFPTLTPDLDQAGNLIYRCVDEGETVKSVIDTFRDTQVTDTAVEAVKDAAVEAVKDAAVEAANNTTSVVKKVAIVVTATVVAGVATIFGVKKYKDTKKKKKAAEEAANIQETQETE